MHVRAVAADVALRTVTNGSSTDLTFVAVEDGKPVFVPAAVPEVGSSPI